MAKTRGIVTKVVQGYSLSPENVEWVAKRAIATSKPRAVVSSSAFLDGVLTALREKQERAEEVFANVQKKVGLPYKRVS